MDSFKDNEFNFMIKAKSYEDWENKVICTGEDKISMPMQVELKERR